MTVTIQEAQIRLAELIAAAMRGEEVVVTQGDQPAAKIVAVSDAAPSSGPRPGSARGCILYMAEDFNAPLEDFEESM